MATTPICRCRVLYLGSAVPHVTKDGLQGIQEPLRDLYPEAGPLSARGIDSWLSVWSNGLLLENVDESQRQHTRFFPIDTLHYCAAVRYVIVPNMQGGRAVEKFLPLDSPFARHAGPSQPPVFACILRRTTGIKVLECHAFICKKEQAANALVRCCFHAYADCTYAKQMEENPYASLAPRRSKSALGLEKSANGSDQSWRNSTSDTPNEDSIMLDDETDTDDANNYKVWNGPSPRDVVYSPPTENGAFNTGTLRSIHSTVSRRPRQLAQPTSAPPPPPPLPPPLERMERMPPMERTLPSTAMIPPPGIVPNSKKEANTLKKLKAKDKKKKGSGSSSKDQLQNGYPIYPMIVYPPPPHMMYAHGAPGRRGGASMFPYEEPVYLPQMRPLSPVASYQPGGFPHEQYFMQYATTPRPATAHGTRPSSRAYKKQQLMPPTQAVNGHHHHNGHSSGHNHTSSSAESSPFNTGIYRKKGHMNERAFSHSIRQEQMIRSRSNSVAALDFDAEDLGDQMQALDLGPPPPPPNGHPTVNGNGYPGQHGALNGYDQVYGHALVETDSKTIEKKTQKKKDKKSSKEKR